MERIEEQRELTVCTQCHRPARRYDESYISCENCGLYDLLHLRRRFSRVTFTRYVSFSIESDSDDSDDSDINLVIDEESESEEELPMSEEATRMHDALVSFLQNPNGDDPNNFREIIPRIGDILRTNISEEVINQDNDHIDDILELEVKTSDSMDEPDR